MMLRADLPHPVPTQRELHQLDARAAALDEITIIYRAVHAQRASYAPDSEAFRALSRVLDLLRARRGDSGVGRPDAPATVSATNARRAHPQLEHGRWLSTASLHHGW